MINFRWAHLNKRNLKIELGGRVQKSVSFPVLTEVLMELQSEITFSWIHFGGPCDGMGILPFLASVACYELPTEQRREQHVLLCCFLNRQGRDEEVQRTLSWAAATGDPAKPPSAERNTGMKFPWCIYNIYRCDRYPCSLTLGLCVIGHKRIPARFK